METNIIKEPNIITKNGFAKIGGDAFRCLDAWVRGFPGFVLNGRSYLPLNMFLQIYVANINITDTYKDRN